MQPGIVQGREHILGLQGPPSPLGNLLGESWVWKGVLRSGVKGHQEGAPRGALVSQLGLLLGPLPTLASPRPLPRLQAWQPPLITHS